MEVMIGSGLIPVAPWSKT